MTRPPLLVAALLLSATLAGCVDGGGETLKSGEQQTTTPKGSGADAPKTQPKTQEDESVRLGKRWHFHNYWGTSPVLTLFDGDVALDAAGVPQVSAPPPSATVGGAEFGLPEGSIVPPETGTVTVTLTWDASPVLASLDVAYRHATSDQFVPAGRVGPGGNVTINVGLDMTDAPHTGKSAWTFRLAAVPNEAGVGVANGTVHALVVAQIGRPIFIDPPHIDHWKNADTLHVLERAWDVHGARTPLPEPAPGYVTLVPDPTAPSAGEGPVLLEARIANGSVIPEGTRTVLARLTWDTPLPPEAGRPSLAYAEENAGTGGPLEPAKDEAGSRLYKLNVIPRMTDNPYGNQSTWRFEVHLDGDAASAFTGTVRLDVWATRLDAASATTP